MKIKICMFCAVIILFVSCTTQMGISNGAFSDISLVRSQENYSVKRLKDVKESGKAVFGIPINPSKNKQGLIYRFNGINLNSANGFLPVLSMIALTAPTALLINSIGGYTYDKKTYQYKDNLGLVLSSILAIPVSGAFNNLLWSGSAFKTAAFNLNSKLLEENPNIDVFLNPKYETVRKDGLWTQSAIISAKVMGATIKVDENLNNQTPNTINNIIDSNKSENTIIRNTEKEKIISFKTTKKSNDIIENKQSNKYKITFPTLAEVYIDDKKITKNPYYPDFTSGIHKISMILNGMKQEKIISLTSEDRKYINTLKINHNGEDLEITNNENGRIISIVYPDNAILLIDGIQINNDEFPYIGAIALGNHQIIIFNNETNSKFKKMINISETDTDLKFDIDFE